MASLAYFTIPSLSVQTAANAYGITSDVNKFNVSSSFVVNGSERVYAMLSGTILLQQQQADANKVNLILRPYDQKELKLPVKYIIYRGLNILDFLDNTSVTDSNNKVKTTGSELLTAMQEIQWERAPGDEIPVQALFGNDLAPVSSKNIEDLFLKNLADSSQLFKIDCGIEMGKFAQGEGSIEIVLENPELPITVDMAKRAKYTIDVTSISDPAHKRWTQDLVRHFVDPAAFYGFHHDISGGIEYRSGSNAKSVANTPALVYQNIIDKFFTKNKVYLDIRNENGYSFNYYNNYKGTGADANKNIKIGQTAATLISKEYNTNGWALHTINVTPGTTAENEIFLSLRIDDNKKPLLAGWNINLAQNTVVDPPLNNSAYKRIYFVDETKLVPSATAEFTNAVSFKIPNLAGGTPASIATIVRLDYCKQPLSTSTSLKFPRKKFTDYLFGSTNLDIPWDTDNKILWYTDSYRTYIDAASVNGFGGFIESGHIIDIDTTTSNNDRIILYSAPLNFFSYKGFEKDMSFNIKGGVLNYDSVLNIIPDIKINRINLKLSSNQNIPSFSYRFKGKLKKAFFMLGITKAEWQAATNTAATALSNLHIKLFKLQSSGGIKTDLDGTGYYDYEILISGLTSTGAYHEVSTGIIIYTVDHFIFSSKSFAEQYQIDYAEAESNLNGFINGLNGDSIKMYKLNCSNEEKENLESGRFWTKYGTGKSNKDLFDLDPTMKSKVIQFKSALDNAQNNFAAIKSIIETKGADLLQYAKQRIKTQGKLYTNKDGILYLTRLMMQVVLKNHPKLLTEFPSKIDELSDIFEKHSRGLDGTEKPVFPPQTSTHFNILISGYDPFGSAFPGSYYDWQDHQSNPSGNLALALDGEPLDLLPNSTKTATIKSVIMPVRYTEFDKGWVEEFFTPYIVNNNIKMIITFSYGIDGIVYDFEMERFAARNRGLKSPDNNKLKAQASAYLNQGNKNDYEFIETTLPYDNMFILDKVGLDQKATFDYYEGATFKEQGFINNASDNDLKDTYHSSVKSIDLTNYPPPNGVADKIKSDEGSGGDYLSNEIYYRVGFLREQLNPGKYTGHIHVGYLKRNTNVDRNTMLSIIKQSLKQALNHF